MSIYNFDYPGWYELCRIDQNMQPLERWFVNYRVDKTAAYCGTFEWLTIEEVVRYTTRGRKLVYYTGVIGSDNKPDVRHVQFDTGAPPPPTFYRAPAQRVKADYTPISRMPVSNLDVYNLLYYGPTSMMIPPYASYGPAWLRDYAPATQPLPPVEPPKPVKKYRRN